MLPAAALAACATKPKGPTKEEVAAGLRAEAEIMKREGEKIDPALQVTNTWNIGAIDIQDDRFTMRYEVRSAKLGGAVAAEGTGLIVAFDYRARAKAALPPEVVSRIRELEGGELAGGGR